MTYPLLLLLLLCLACASMDPEQPRSADAPSANFVGTWNYDYPDGSSGLNVAQLECPASDTSPAFKAFVPQIGNIVLSQTGPTSISGTTDQGCTWQFTARGADASLASAQTCFNPVIGSSYTITRWSLTLMGTTATEVLEATSHQVVDCPFTLTTGRRSRVDSGSSTDPASAFLGTWSYSPPDVSGRNMTTRFCDARAPEQLPQNGQLTIESAGFGRIAVTAEPGCTAILSVAGNTARLEAADPHCSAVPTFWTMATDGAHLTQLTRVIQEDCELLLVDGELVRE